MEKKGGDSFIAPYYTSSSQKVQLAGVVELFGSVQSGPNPDLASGTLSMAKGPALCSPL